MSQPKFALGDRVQIVADYWKEDLRHRVGLIADPGPHLRHAKPRWPDTYWKAESRRIYYWVEFAAPGPTLGELCAAEVDEDHLVPA
ncbi:MAG TPA: hypothetical protein VFS19_00020 [Planctomycetota bacterium]|nr:hypothetical protein [Planctomycetota bacterium]